MNTLVTNKNFLQQVSFRLTINNERFSNLEYFCVAANLPSASMTEISTPFRNQSGFTPGDRINYSDLTIKFMVDEDMANYIEVLKWLQTNQTSDRGLRADLTLSLLTAKNNVNRQFRFTDAFPTSISDLQFDSQATTIDYVTCTVTLKYNYFQTIE